MMAAANMLPGIGDWWQLPSGRTVSVRRIMGAGHQAEAVVRYVDAQGGMAQGEFELRVAYIVRGRKVGHDAS